MFPVEGTSGSIGGGLTPVWSRRKGRNANQCVSVGGLGWPVLAHCRQCSAGGVGAEFSAIADFRWDSGIYLYRRHGGAAYGWAGKFGEWRWSAAAELAD